MPDDDPIPLPVLPRPEAPLKPPVVVPPPSTVSGPNVVGQLIKEIGVAAFKEASDLLKMFLPQVAGMAPALHCQKQYIYTNGTNQVESFKVTVASLAGYDVGIDNTNPEHSTDIPNGGSTTFGGTLLPGGRIFIHVHYASDDEQKAVEANPNGKRPWSLVGWGDPNITLVGAPAAPAFDPGLPLPHTH